ncbi:MAG: radical SAM protein [Candidatus Wolfebacteria bacterium]|nr:radical SAM protein [Candidatus Wolfebacteria bacterium]
MYKTLTAPLSVHLEVNTACNQKCRHCYNFWREKQPDLDMVITEDLTRKVINQLASLRVFHVILNGGEPPINFERLIFVMRELKQKGITFSLNSNLTLVTLRMAEELKKEGLRTVLTSLMSYKPATHDFLANHRESFEKVTQGIKNARMANLRVAVNMVVSKPNLYHIEQTGRLAKNLGAFAFSATRVMPPRLSEMFDANLVLGTSEVQEIVTAMLRLRDTGLQLDSLVPYPACFFEKLEEYELLGGRTCSAGKTSLAIAADGSVRTCPHHEKVYGTIVQEELSSIWLKMTSWRDGSLLPPACLSCRLLPQCGGGCRVSLIGDIIGQDPIMAQEKAQIFSVPKNRSVSVRMTPLSMFRIRKICRFRNDKEIGVVNTGGIKNTFVTVETMDVLQKLHASQVALTPLELQAAFGISMDKDEYSRFLAELVRREVAEILPS